MAAKRKVTVTLDEDLVRALEHAGNVSAQLNEAGWSLVERRQRAQRLTELLDHLDEQYGPLPDNPDEDARLERLLGGAA
jgi:hypothetical protein